MKMVMKGESIEFERIVMQTASVDEQPSEENMENAEEPALT